MINRHIECNAFAPHFQAIPIPEYISDTTKGAVFVFLVWMIPSQPMSVKIFEISSYFPIHQPISGHVHIHISIQYCSCFMMTILAFQHVWIVEFKVFTFITNIDFPLLRLSLSPCSMVNIHTFLTLQPSF